MEWIVSLQHKSQQKNIYSIFLVISGTIIFNADRFINNFFQNTIFILLKVRANYNIHKSIKIH